MENLVTQTVILKFSLCYSLVKTDLNSQWYITEKVEFSFMPYTCHCGSPLALLYISFFIFIFLIILLLFNYSCLHFPLTTPPDPSQAHCPPLLLPSPLVLSMCPLQQFLKTLPPIVPSPLHSGYCQIVLDFNVSGYILFAFFFC